MNTITFTMPLPAKELNPNVKSHWAVKAEKVKDYRTSTSVVAYAAWGDFGDQWTKATAQATFYHAANRRRDPDNLAASLKAIWDGVTDSQIISDDSTLIHLPVVKLKDKDNPRVEITIRKGWHESIK